MHILSSSWGPVRLVLMGVMCVVRLREKASEFEKRGVVLSSVRSVSEPLHLGRLQGNHFDLVVRDLRSHQGHGTLMELDSRVQEAVENVKVRHSYSVASIQPWSWRDAEFCPAQH